MLCWIQKKMGSCRKAACGILGKSSGQRAANRRGKERHMQITGGWVYDPEEGFAERTVCTDGEKIARSSGDEQNLDASGC